MTHSTLSNMNRARSYNKDIKSNLLDGTNTNVNKLLDSDIASDPLCNLLFNLEIISFTCISLLIILSIQIITKTIVKDKIELNMSNLIGIYANNNLEYYINNIIVLNKRMSTVYIYILLLLLLFALGLMAYISEDLYYNIDMYVSVHNNIKKN